ncbi:Uncharacterized protein GBIM_00658 [Gryllus bimaculatus]|nr:Uncharacterized protein GBIM_00658 [Gryllus bimaculatus]
MPGVVAEGLHVEGEAARADGAHGAPAASGARAGREPQAAHERNNMMLKALNIRACNQQSRMRNYDVTATLTKDCTVNMRACFNVTRVLNETKINYRINKPPLINKAGSVDWCKQADELCEDEEQRVGISCPATRAQGPAKKGAKQQQKRNKFAPVQCPLRPGRRCISHVVDVKEIKPHRRHVMGTFKVSATVDHGAAGSSCIDGSFTIADSAQG